MIVDTSAFVSILINEATADACIAAILDSPEPLIGAPNMLEATIVLRRRGDTQVEGDMASVQRDLGLGIAPFTGQQYDIARQAHRLYGKGTGSKAQLNFGDCMAYALATAYGQPLLFVGDDFRHTDVKAALP